MARKAGTLLLGLALGLGIGLSLAYTVGGVSAQDAPKGDDEKKPTPEEEAAMAAWMKVASPSEGHQILARMAGEWSTVTKFFMDPGAEPQVSTGTASSEMFFGGRFLRSTFKGEMHEGMAFEGLGINGFNNLTQKYESFWCDNMGTLTLYAEGTYDAEKKVLTQEGSFADPMRGGEVSAFRWVTTFKDDGTHVFEIFAVLPNGETKRDLVVTYTRKTK